MKKKQEPQINSWRFERLTPEPREGLTGEQARVRAQAGARNELPQGITPTVGKIIFKNICTLFNLINLILAVTILIVGSPENTMFFGIAICNTLMGIIQELRAKRTLDKLSVLAQSKVLAVRDGHETSLDQEQVVLDDIVVLSTGNQVCVDSEVVLSEGFEVNEALLTGEADNIPKNEGDRVLSGSFVTSGRAWVRVTAVGGDSYATALTVEARREKKATTPLMRTLNNIIRVLTVAVVPIGALLFWSQYSGPEKLQEAVLGASTGVLGMIPEGLILLTGVTLTVGALRLAGHKALVQTLPAIETLARVDVLCLDKTGTITDGTLTFEEILPVGEHNLQQAETALRELMGALSDSNATAAALRGALGEKSLWRADAKVPFSSARKWSGAFFEGRGSYILGAPGFVFPAKNLPFFDTIGKYAKKGQRVLCLAHSNARLAPGTLPGGLECVALVVLSDTIRREAPDTFAFFASEGVTLKVISGDDPVTVSTIAARAGIHGAERWLDMSAVGGDVDYLFLVENYTVFGRVSPQQKRTLIRALKHNGHTCCMTGDGVNDVLAMREASCSVAMVGGSDAARGAGDFVLMTSDFSAMVEVLQEGRRVINNIENVASLYLVKTIYSTILSVLYIFLPYPYPFAPLMMTPINALTVGIPSFFLALRRNLAKPEGKFLINILENALPAALTVVFNVLIVLLAGICFGLSSREISTMSVLLTGSAGLILLLKVSAPATRRILALNIALAVMFLASFFVPPFVWQFENLVSRNIFFYLPLLYTTPRMFSFLSGLIRRLAGMADSRVEV